MKLFMLIVLSMTMLYSKGAVSLESIFKSTFSQNVKIGQKTITLSKSEMKALQKKAKAVVDSSTIRYYVVKEGKSTVGHGVLVVQRLRTKMAAILYLISKDGKIKNIEIIAFHEPSEYKPYTSWREIFVGKTKNDTLKMGHDIPTISGATFSARAFTYAARIALVIVEQEKK